MLHPARLQLFTMMDAGNTDVLQCAKRDESNGSTLKNNGMSDFGLIEEHLGWKALSSYLLLERFFCGKMMPTRVLYF